MHFIKKLLIGLTISLSLFAFNAIGNSAPLKTVTIGILVPVKLPALDEVVAGFEGELNHLYNTDNTRVIYLVQNAQGSTDAMRSILTQFKNQNVDMVVPIGTLANQMALSVIKTQPIVALAARFTEADRANSPNKNVTNIVDELTIEQQLAFIHKAIPTLKRLTLIYSPEDRDSTYIQKANIAAQNNGITLQLLKVKQPSEFSKISNQINTNSQAIFILKDELIVSVVPQLANIANARHIPLIASDTGSVENGAAFEVGVGERQIGSDAATLALKVLQGTPAKDVPIVLMTNYRVFINSDAAAAQHLDLSGVVSAARFYNYLVIYPDAM